MTGDKVSHHLWGRPLSESVALAKKSFPDALESKMPTDLEAALADYFGGAAVDLSRWARIPDGCSTFASRVYFATKGLKWGETVTYSDIAALIGSPRAVRAVGTALGRNPTPLFIPCHRVLLKTGEGGWSGPPGLKAKLLNLEKGTAILINMSK